MNYDLAINAANAKTEEEFQTKLNEYLHSGELSKRSLTYAMREVFPNDNVMVTSSSEQRQRAALSEKMQNAMVRRLHDIFETNRSRESLKLPLPQTRKRIQFDRQIRETILHLPFISQNGEYVKRYTTMVNGTPEEKAELLLKLFQEEKDRLAAKGWTREKLKHLTNDEIAENFDDLQDLKNWHGAMQYLSGSSLFSLTDEQRMEFRKFETEYDVVPWVYNKTRLITNPNYRLARIESLPEFDNSELDWNNLLPDGEYPDEELVLDENGNPLADQEPSAFEKATKALAELFNSVDSLRTMARTGLQTDVERQLEGLPNTDVRWFDPLGRPLKTTFFPNSYREDQTAPPLDDLVAGRKLTAMLPNGTVKVFSAAISSDGSLQFHTEVRSKILTGAQQENAPKAQPVNAPEAQQVNMPEAQQPNAPAEQQVNAPKAQQENMPETQPVNVPEGQMDRTILERLRTLSQKLDDADPWYIKSSPEYKNVQAALKQMQNDWHALGENPTASQLDRFKEQMTSLAGTAGAYLGIKADKKHFNEREQARKDAVLDIQMFANQLIAEVSNPQNERAENGMAQQREQSGNAERSNDIRSAARPRMSEKETVRAFVTKMSDLMHIACPPSKQAGSALNDLHSAAYQSLQTLISCTDSPTLSSIQAPVKRNLATLTLFHLIIAERGNQFDGTAGPLEQALAAKGQNTLIKSISDTPVFNQLIGNLTPSRLTDFILTDGARNIAKQLIANSRDSQKQAENPEKAAQKDMANPMQK